MTVPKEVIRAGKKTAPAPTVREKAQEAAILGLERLISLLHDPDTSNADVFKAVQLIFDRVMPSQGGSDAPGGDFDICVKEE